MATQAETNGVNPDLAKERSSATFNVEQMTNFLDRGEETTKRRREIQQMALKVGKIVRIVYYLRVISVFQSGCMKFELIFGIL